MDKYEQISQLGQVLQKKFEATAESESLRFIENNFRQEGYSGSSVTPWEKRKKETKQTINKKILIGKTARLRRGFRARVTSTGEVKIFNDVPYAEIHNNGGEIKQASRSETFLRNRHKETVYYKKGKNAGRMKQMKGQFAKGTTAGKGFTFAERTIKIPRRQMLPTDDSDSPVLRAAIESKLQSEMRNLESLLNNNHTKIYNF